jgi:hypothetical protein
MSGSSGIFYFLERTEPNRHVTETWYKCRALRKRPMNSIDLLFRSSRFNLSEVGEQFINPCCFGEDLAAWLREKLSASGMQVDPSGQEDWVGILASPMAVTNTSSASAEMQTNHPRMRTTVNGASSSTNAVPSVNACAAVGKLNKTTPSWQ